MLRNCYKVLYFRGIRLAGEQTMGYAHHRSEPMAASAQKQPLAGKESK